MRTAGRLGVLITCLTVLSLGLQGQDAPPQAPARVQAPSAAAVPSDAVPQAVDSANYVIGPQDVLRIEVWQDNTLTRQVVVQPDGKFQMPFIGTVVAEGLTPARLETQLEQYLTEIIQVPDVTVSVMQVNSKTYKVTGWVNRSGTFPLIKPTTVYDAIIEAGGFREFANKKDVRIMRGAERIKFNANDYEKGKNLDQNIVLQNGDTVMVHD